MEKRNKVIQILIIVSILFFFAYQYYVGFYASIATESAVTFEYTEGIDATATFIRNEVALTSDDSGTVHFLVSNGEKVAKDGKIADIFSNDAASAAASRIAEIDKQLKLISEIEGYNDTTAVDVDTINQRISSHLNSFVYATQDGRFTDAGNCATELLTMMTRKQVATGQQSDFSVLKADLNSEKSNLLLQMGSPKKSIFSNTAGYFVSNADGYEKVLTSSNLENTTPEYIENLKQETVAENVIGKIVYDYEWFLAIPVTLNDSMHYKVSDTVTVKIDTSSISRITATIHSINLSDTEEKAVMILRCNAMNSELASLRTASVKIIRKEYSGIKVDSKAIRIVDSVTGVYVVSGLEAKFVTVNILYSDDDYKICELNTADTSKLRLYDEIIVKGKNLYDGKIIY